MLEVRLFQLNISSLDQGAVFNDHLIGEDFLLFKLSTEIYPTLIF